MKLAIGYQDCFEIRRYDYPLSMGAGLRIVYLSDLHFNRFSGPMAGRILLALEELRPDLVLLGGDYVDSSRGLRYFEHMMRNLPEQATVAAVAGNHDRIKRRRLRAIVEGAGGIWVEDGGLDLLLRGVRVRIHGTVEPATGSSGKETVTGSGWQVAILNILLLHRPIDPKEAADRYHLIFAGHLHGCQVVLRKTGKGLYPGRWLYRWNRLDWRSGDCHYFISKGLGDTLPIRYDCPKDIILVNIPAASAAGKTP